MKEKIYFILIILFTCVWWAYGEIENNHLKLYVSFDNSVNPEIALDGSGLFQSGKMNFVDGKLGKALLFTSSSDIGDLLYSTGNIMQKNEWTIAMWVMLDKSLKRGHESSRRYIFRTNLSWKNGNVYAGFDNWGKLNFNQFDADKKSNTTSLSSAPFLEKQWTHVAFGHKNGTRYVYINGEEAIYSKNENISALGKVQNILRIGSMDFKSRDQLNGAIDELKVFDKLLSSSELKEIMESKPGQKKVTALLVVPFNGKVDPVGAENFHASELVFAKGKSGGGVKIMRHGYDRRGLLKFNGIKAIGGNAVSCAFYFISDWDGEKDDNTHGLFHVTAGSLKYGLAKSGDKIILSLESQDEKQEISLPASLLKKDKAVHVAIGFDFNIRKMFLTVDHKTMEVTLNISYANNQTTGSMLVGDILENNTYSKTQAEGVIDKLYVVSGYFSASELVELQKRESQKRSSSRNELITVSPVKEQEKKLWDLYGAENLKTSTREKITLNALWRMQLTNNEIKFDPAQWIYLAVPGRYSGQASGMADCEFYMRDAKLKKLSRNAQYKGKNPYSFVSGYFERAFIARKEWEHKQIVFLLDELSRSQRGIVYLNGKEIARLETGRYFEIPFSNDLLRFGEYNYLTIHAMDSGRYWAWRGIKGNTWIEIKPLISIEHPGIITSVKDESITFEATVKNTSDNAENVFLEVMLDGTNALSPSCSDSISLPPNETRKITFTVPWKNAQYWSPDSPYLYHCTFILRNEQRRRIDELLPVRFGFREFEIRGKNYYLNGKRIHLFNHEGWANASADIDEARRVARTLKGLGYNAVRTNFPAESKDNYLENIMKVCDEEGLLQLVGIDGVSSNELVLWNNPETQKNLEAKMAGMIRKWKNHPSNIMYFMSTNLLGYGWDFHPLKMADCYLPYFNQNKYKICMEAVKIMRKYDSSRPFFFQAGGNFGEVITNNAYFCWWPQTERNAWPAVWSKIGKKPLHVIETSFPYWRSFYGMDLKYPGAKPLFYYENLARYYGPKAYLDDDAEMLNAVALSTQGKYGQVYYDAPLHQQFRSELLRDTIPYWRGFGISGICPFEEVFFAFRKNKNKEWEVEVEDFRRNGWHGDLKKIQYQKDIKHDEPLPVAEALKDVLKPELIFIDGGEDEPVDKTHNYYSGEKIQKRIVLINNTMKDSRFKGKWSLAKHHGTFEEILKPGAIKYHPLTIVLPEVSERTVYKLTVEPENYKMVSLDIVVFPKITVNNSNKIALYDSKGMTAETLRNLGLKAQNAVELDSLKEVRLLLIGRESLTLEFMSVAKRLNLKEAVDSGRTNVVVFEQNPEGLALVGLKTAPIYARNTFPGNNVVFPGLEDEDFSYWAGNSTLSPSKQPPSANTEDRVATPLWHWNNANIVSSYPIQRPVEGNFRILLSCGKDLTYTPLFELKSGNGRVLFCQLEISGRSLREPAAEYTVAGLLEEYAKENQAKPESHLIIPEKITDEETVELLKQVENGAVLIVPQGNAKLFGGSVKTQKVNRFTITEAGRKYWPLLTARDTYLRAPQEMNIISGKQIVPLTEPAFAAIMKHGKGTVLFLEFPSFPQQKELERGLKYGVDSSTAWSAEILAERFTQMRNLVKATYGKEYPLMAERFENMYLSNLEIDLNGEWDFRTDPQKNGLKEGWQNPEAFRYGDGWEKITVPGYFNNLLPHIGKFVGIVWYRKKITLSDEFQGQELFLDIGAVDDLDETYVNGVKIGYTNENTAGYWAVRRLYSISEKLTRGKTLYIAVRADNLRGNGGITGYAKILMPRKNMKNNPFPYAGKTTTYNTESHVRW